MRNQFHWYGALAVHFGISPALLMDTVLNIGLTLHSKGVRNMGWANIATALEKVCQFYLGTLAGVSRLTCAFAWDFCQQHPFGLILHIYR